MNGEKQPEHKGWLLQPCGCVPKAQPDPAAKCNRPALCEDKQRVDELMDSFTEPQKEAVKAFVRLSHENEVKFRTAQPQASLGERPEQQPEQRIDKLTVTGTRKDGFVFNRPFQLSQLKPVIEVKNVMSFELFFGKDRRVCAAEMDDILAHSLVLELLNPDVVSDEKFCYDMAVQNRDLNSHQESALAKRDERSYVCVNMPFIYGTQKSRGGDYGMFHHSKPFSIKLIRQAGSEYLLVIKDVKQLNGLVVRQNGVEVQPVDGSVCCIVDRTTEVSIVRCPQALVDYCKCKSGGCYADLTLSFE